MNPIPSIPFPLLRGRGGNFLRGAKPLLNSLIIVLEKKIRERRSLSYTTDFPLSFKGEGDKGGEVDKESHLEKN